MSEEKSTTQIIYCEECKSTLMGAHYNGCSKINKDQIPFAKTGWICPVCGAGNSPYTSRCSCKQTGITWTTEAKV